MLRLDFLQQLPAPIGGARLDAVRHPAELVVTCLPSVAC
jgi:hypothetical protein